MKMTNAYSNIKTKHVNENKKKLKTIQNIKIQKLWV